MALPEAALRNSNHRRLHMSERGREGEKKRGKPDFGVISEPLKLLQSPKIPEELQLTSDCDVRVGSCQ